MKKSSRKKLFKTLFWLVFAAAAAWLALVPPGHRPVARFAPPAEVTVRVAKPSVPPPESAPATVSGAEEKTAQPVPPPPALSSPPPQPAMPGGKTKSAPQIAIVIDDVGVDYKDSAVAIEKLPAPVTLSFLPYAVRLREQAREAAGLGHEMILHMPMEPVGHEDPGPGALFTSLPMPVLQQRFDDALASFTGFDGVNNHMGSKFTAWPDGMKMVVGELQQRHLFYLDSRTSAQSVGLKIAREEGLPSIGRDVFLDDIQEPDAVRAQLQETENIARRRGYAVAIGHPHPVTLAVLQAWIPQAEKDGFTLVPLHDLVRQVSPE